VLAYTPQSDADVQIASLRSQQARTEMGHDIAGCTDRTTSCAADAAYADVGANNPSHYVRGDSIDAAHVLNHDPAAGASAGG
jgi:hypothetical protein